MSNDEVNTSKNTKYSFNSIFKIFLKTGKRRLIITILTGIALFLVLSTFFMSWFSYRYTSFTDYIKRDHNWRKDGNTSVYITEYLDSPEDLTYSYLDDSIRSSIDILDEIIPNVVDNYTAGLSAELYKFIEPLNETYTTFKFLSLDNNSNEILANCLVDGRMPANQSEILFFRQSVNYSYALNDIIYLRGINHAAGAQQNFTIVGIIDNVKGQLYTHGFSQDIITRLAFGDYYYYENDSYMNSIFFSNNDFLTSIVRNFTLYTGAISVAIDFNYQITANHIRNIPQYIKNFEIYYYNFYYYFNSFCGDLYYAFVSFDEQWLMETIRMFICSIPILIVFGLVCVEVFKIGTHELESKFTLMKIQGMEYKAIRKMIVLENLIFSASSLLSGTILGYFISYFVFRGFGNTNFSDYSFSLLEPVIFIILTLLFLFFFLGGFLLENSLAKKTAKLTPSRYRSKRSERFRRFIRTPEVAMFLTGLGLLAIGFVGYLLINIFGFLPTFNFFKFILAFSYVMGVGGLFVIISVFLFLSRLVMLLWQFIGKRVWMKTKSYVTLSLKHLSIYNKNYQRAILIIFILSLAVTPGIISSRSAKTHNHFEASLKTGYADLMVTDWQTYFQPIRQNITNIDGIVNSVEINFISYYIYDSFDIGYTRFIANAIIVDNITNFLDVVNDELYTITSYSKEDVAKLEGNMTCFVDTKHAKDLDLINGSKVVMEFLENMFEPIETTYIQSFEYFPTILTYETFYSRWFEQADYVVSGLTWKTLKNYTRMDTYPTTEAKLLLKTTTNANITYIREVLADNYGLEVITGTEVEQQLNEQVNYFGISYFAIATVVALIASMFFGYITARNIYHQRLRIIESQYQIGAKRNQIWLSYTIELLFIIILPLVVGLATAIPLLKAIMPFILNLDTDYYKFSPWVPWWIILIIFSFGYIVITSGWLLEIIPLVKKYRPIKQE
ncbi:MAG TPA: ABC transporter permease [Candidatus Bathyarchaeia archaeon]|nr:ABC transporter permease [Candidatus Bathyarchaeia archaeon]